MTTMLHNMKNKYFIEVLFAVTEFKLLSLANTQNMLLFCLFHSDQNSSSSGTKQMQLDIVTPVLLTDFRVICGAICKRYHILLLKPTDYFSGAILFSSSLLECH